MTRLARQVKTMVGAVLSRHALQKTAAISVYQFARYLAQEAELGLSQNDRLRLGLGPVKVKTG